MIVGWDGMGLGAGWDEMGQDEMGCLISLCTSNRAKSNQSHSLRVWREGAVGF